MKELLRKISFLLLLLVAGFTSFSQDAVYSQKLLDKLEAVKGHSHANLKTMGAEEQPHGCMTMVLREARENFSKLTSEAQEVFSVLGAADRPSISGTESTFSTTHFKIHYTITSTSTDKVPATDTKGNGIPDYIDSIASVVEAVYKKEITNLGYPMPPSDGATGGDSKYDVYVRSIGKYYYGYVAQEDYVGNNSNSTQKETDAYTSFMVLNNDYTWVTGITTLDAIKVTVAHEFFHGIQYGITADCSYFFAESTAAWMEDIAYPGIDDNFQYMSSIFRNPDVALDFADGEDGSSSLDGHWYGGWVFWRYITDQYDVDLVRKVWIRAINEFENDAYDNELKAYGSTLRTTFNNWLIANQFVSSSVSYSPYTYDRGSDYSSYLLSKYSLGSVKKEKSYSYTGPTINHVSNVAGNSRLQRFSADYFTITPNQNFTVSLKPVNQGKDFQLFLIKANNSNSNFSIVQGTDLIDSIAFSVNDASSYNSFTIVVSRFARDADITSEQYTLSIFKYKAVTTGVDNGVVLNTGIYPNPASKEVIIDYSIDKATTLSITDLTGKTVLTTELQVNTNGQLPLDVTSWTPGVYVVMFKNQDGFVGRQRLIVNR